MAVDEMLAARLKEARPAYGWLSEESPEHTARLAASRVWVVDPIDGTRDFLRGGRDWTIALALVEDGAPVLSSVINPVHEEIFEAQAGKGAWLNGHRIHVSRQDRLAGARVAIGRAGFTKGAWRKPWPDASARSGQFYALPDGPHCFRACGRVFCVEPEMGVGYRCRRASRHGGWRRDHGSFGSATEIQLERSANPGICSCNPGFASGLDRTFRTDRQRFVTSDR